MKTIFISILQGIEAKNLLRTNVIPEILSRGRDIRIVLLVRTRERAEYYRRDFSDPRLVYEVLSGEPRGFLEQVFSALKFLMLRTATTDLRRRMKFDQEKNFLSYVAGRIANHLLARPFIRRVVRALDFLLVRGGCFAPLYDRYLPDAVFLAHLFDDVEIELLREAKRRNIRAIGFINSWDKLTARCVLRLLPDLLLVYNEIVQREAILHADMRADQIRVVGIPQYDLYQRYTPLPRNEFLQAIGIPEQKRFILYAPMGETFSGSDWAMIDLLKSAIDGGELPADVELFVRFQPNDRFDERQIAERSWLRYDRPGIRFTAARGVDWDMRADEMRRLADTLSHMSLLVCYASSISVDAAIFGKPIININFELHSGVPLMRSPTQFYRMEHYKNALATGGIRLVSSRAELLEWIRRYLKDPALDTEARAQLVSEQCGPCDGNAGARIASAVIEAIRHNQR